MGNMRVELVSSPGSQCEYLLESYKVKVIDDLKWFHFGYLCFILGYVLIHYRSWFMIDPLT